MREITAGELSKILEEHKRWLATGKKEGKRADLSGADLSGANLMHVRGLTIEQLSSVETYCDAELSSEQEDTIIESYEQTIRIYPDNASNHKNLGLAYDKLSKNEEAIESYKHVIRIDPDFRNAHYNLACRYSLLGNINKALKSLGKAIDLGFDDIKHIENDSDLNGLRDEAGYKKLINKLKRIVRA
jgi:tetratricopeptide (TPR) repeat protein